MKLESAETGVTIIDTDWEKADISAKNFDDVVAQKSTNMNKRYITAPFKETMTYRELFVST